MPDGNKKGTVLLECCQEIPCNPCATVCKTGAITKETLNSGPVFHPEKCVGCKLCTKVCPRDAILPIATAEEKEKYKAIKKAQAEKAAAAKAAETAGAAQ